MHDLDEDDHLPSARVSILMLFGAALTLALVLAVVAAIALRQS
nr:hypothetical protein [uncultured Bradyrhizobium sp.]